ncbi:hypothetical protein BCR34DRAFT_659834 [Clohesyomyces aquaticus]|uniref:Ecp2 effector protein domain-containing protein n=1 Tax=Clohesyomyces aquaticus TaxID=1231657 RepID=A0A1Y2A9M6_9PLEO|nr:hypothetical protein BCR34DRAFT_659834 [Clohesyomyces aquaticus]
MKPHHSLLPACLTLFTLLQTSHSAPVDSPIIPAIWSSPNPTFPHALQPRQGNVDDRVCEYNSNPAAMATTNDAYAAASYLESLGDTGCGHSRVGWYDPRPNYLTMWQTGTVQVNIYFTATNIQVLSATFYCRDVGRYVRELIDACRTDQGRIQGRRWVPNCPNKEIVFAAGSAVPDQEGGSAIEVMPANWRQSGH